MKRSVLLLAALFAVFSVQADIRPQAVLKQLTAALGALEGYSVVFEVHTDGDVVPGYYEVSGDNYYMHVNDMGCMEYAGDYTGNLQDEINNF